MSRTTGQVIEVFADIWCPFAHVGLRAIDEERARADSTDVAIRVRAWPLELVNGAPLDPGLTKEHADDLRNQVAPDLFAHLDPDRFPTSTLGALALANRAYQTDLGLGELVSFALRDALFEEGRDISDPVILEHLAHDLGVDMPDESDRAGVLADWDEGRRRGVRSSQEPGRLKRGCFVVGRMAFRLPAGRDEIRKGPVRMAMRAGPLFLRRNCEAVRAARRS